MLKRVSILAVVAMLATATVANAFPPLAEWTFEVSLPTTAGPLDAEGGINAGPGSPASGSHAGTTTYSNPVGNGSAESFSSTNWLVGDYYQFCTSTVGYSGITFEWDQGSSNTGPRDFELHYNVNGGAYTTLAGTYTILANAAPNNTWNSTTRHPEYLNMVDLSAITALDNQNQICIRVVQNSAVSANCGTVASGGTSRVDNAVISGVPEPTTLALMGLGAIGLIRRRR
jgi:hypothetical protein